MDDEYNDKLLEYKKTACEDIIQIIQNSFPSINTDGVEDLIREYFGVDE